MASPLNEGGVRRGAAAAEGGCESPLNEGGVRRGAAAAEGGCESLSPLN